MNSTLVGILYILLWVVIIAGIIGWVLNIIQLVALLSAPFSLMIILKAVGIFVAPLGGLLGWI